MIHRIIMSLATLLFVPCLAAADEQEWEYDREVETEIETEDGITETEVETETETEYETESDVEGTGIGEFIDRAGMSAEVGGGVYGFTDPAMRNVVDVGGLWNARLIVGTRSLFGVELAYVGTASGLDALGLDDSTVLVASGGEGALRLNILRGTIRPYVFAGVGFKHYQLYGDAFNTSSVADSDNVLELPVGAGLDFQIARSLTLGGRFAVRPAFGEELVGGGGEPEMHTMSGDLRLGYQF